jgi:hypothetical protein
LFWSSPWSSASPISVPPSLLRLEDASVLAAAPELALRPWCRTVFRAWCTTSVGSSDATAAVEESSTSTSLGSSDAVDVDGELRAGAPDGAAADATAMPAAAQPAMNAARAIDLT